MYISSPEIFVDNFAGGGGASTGIEMAIGRSVDIAINHDSDAIAMHKTNHPSTKHYCEDVWQVDPVEACAGRKVALAWFSPDCKHFSRAKGGKPVDKNIRGLAWVAIKWALLVQPRVIMLENVPEIQTWGPLGKDGKPIKERAGETFNGFLAALSNLGLPKDHPAFKEMCFALGISETSETAEHIAESGCGYTVEYRALLSCDYGAPTKRKRFYLIARRDGRQIVWPEPTHADKSSNAVKAGLRRPYRTAAECIDWELPAQSIFDRKKPLAENTMKRIARGIQKFVVDNPEPFIVNYKFENAPTGTDEPLSTVTSVNNHYLVSPVITAIGQTGRSKDRSKGIDEPLSTIVTKQEHLLVAPTLIQYHSETCENEVRGQEIEKPVMTVDTSNRYGLATAFIAKHFGGNYAGSGSDADDPLHTVTTQDHNSLVTAHIMTLRNNMDGQRMDEPLYTVSAGGTHHAEVMSFLAKYYGGDGSYAQGVDEPLHTVTTKDRFGLVTVNSVDYVITDIRMRMLQPQELFRAMGFPEDYIIDRDVDGNPYPKSKQVARCGNAVTPPVPEALVRANLPELCYAKKRNAPAPAGTGNER